MQAVRKNPETWIWLANRMTSFGDMIRKARKDKNLVQRELARLIDSNIEGAHIWRWEAGKNLPTADRLVRLIEVLDLDPDQTWRAWGEAQLTTPPDPPNEVAEAVSPTEEAVGTEPDPRTASDEPKPPRARAPRPRRGTRRTSS